ncbi:MAG: hypothetical protein LBQ81_09905 [Zoogloeaceae bacterium]|nr:hypothetical protein [Zoogloeaceae bacterium]
MLTSTYTGCSRPARRRKAGTSYQIDLEETDASRKPNSMLLCAGKALAKMARGEKTVKVFFYIFVILTLPVTLILPYALWLCASILALTLPKTWRGKALALLLVMVFIFIDWMVVEQWQRSSGGDRDKFLAVPFLHYGLLAVFVAAIAARKASEGKTSLTLLLVVWFLFLVFPGYSAWERKAELDKAEERTRKHQEIERAWAQRQAQAKAMFPESCKKSGKFIHRTAENVDGFMILRNISIQLEMPLRDQGYHYIDHVFTGLGVWSRRWPDGKEEWVVKKDSSAYRINQGVEANREDAGFDRYVHDLINSPAPYPAPRYGLIGYDISTREERDNKIEGHSLKVIDLQTKEVLAERIRYQMMTYRDVSRRVIPIWVGCPPFPAENFQDSNKDMNFIVKVLKPSPH